MVASPQHPLPGLRRGLVKPDAGIPGPLLEQRTIFISSEINDKLANVVIAQLLFLQFQDARRDIHLYLNSTGGSVAAGLAIYDTMAYVKPAVATYAVGQAAGMALLLLVAGTKGKRHALPHAKLAFTRLSGGAKPRNEADVETQRQEIAQLRKAVFDIYAKHTGQPTDLFAKLHDEGRVLSHAEALGWQLIDKVC